MKRKVIKVKKKKITAKEISEKILEIINYNENCYQRGIKNCYERI